MTGLSGNLPAGNAEEVFSPASGSDPPPGRKRFLHAGCGQARKPNVAPGLCPDDWEEIRLDIDPAVKPDILGSMLDMSQVPSASMNAVYTSHTLEHLYAHEVPQALAEMRRVLRADGMLIVTVPDLQAAAAMIAQDRLYDTAYVSSMGPVAPFDILYSHRALVGRDQPHMAHHGGFTLTTLTEALRAAGFPGVHGWRRERYFDLWALATCQALAQDALRELARRYLPP